MQRKHHSYAGAAILYPSTQRIAYLHKKEHKCICAKCINFKQLRELLMEFLFFIFVSSFIVLFTVVFN